ncbi:hypothetical protein SK128_009751 [Halocaridina rubra]|uniref:Uncharacterized protein n=1 Tax=Halocaridina rubra TaxID=373956 RepID=A0AAN8XR71_HALRR
MGQKVFNKIIGLLRRAPSVQVLQLITLRSECEPVSLAKTDYILPLLIALLMVLNGAFIYLVYDLLMAIRECKGTGAKVRDPKLHIIVTGVSNYVRRKFQSHEPKKLKDDKEDYESVTYRAKGGAVTLQIPRISIDDRGSCTLRTQRRRRTPCPN